MNASKEQSQEIVSFLINTRALLFQQLDSLIRVAAHLLETAEFHPVANPTEPRLELPSANPANFTAHWQSKSCFLGNTLLFRFFERLAKTPNIYVSHQELLDDVWGDDRTASTIRGVAKRLKDKLNACGLHELSDCIVGSEIGHYGLMIV